MPGDGATPVREWTDPLRIGPLRWTCRVVPAPMSGYTDAPMRRLCGEFGAEIAFTEMVNAAGLVRGASKTARYLDTLPGEAPAAAHLYGNDPETLAAAAAWVEASGRFAAVDLNAGCPVRKIVSKGAGAALMRDPARLEKIVAAMRSATKLPLLVKTRIGLSPREGPLVEGIERIAGAGADALTIHARYAAHGHGGEPDLAALAEVCRRVSIPVIGNGGIDTAEAARRMVRESGVDGVAIGRAILGAPWVPGRMAAELAGAAPAPLSLGDRRNVIERHLALQRRLAEMHPDAGPGGAGRAGDAETVAVRRFRPHLARYLRGMQGAGDVRKGLNALRSFAEVRAALDACFDGPCQKMN